MTYVLTNCALPESLLTGASHKRFNALMVKATAVGVVWDYSFADRRLIISNAPAGLEGQLSQYGTVEVKADA